MEITAVDGLISIDSSTACVTVSVVDPEMPPEVAEIVVEPAATDVVSPLEPGVLLMVATALFEESHDAVEEISCVELSENVPVATNCWVVPSTILGFTGVTVIAVRISGVTVRIAGVDVTVKNDAAIVAVPSLTAVASPALLIVATPRLDEDQVATVVRTCCAESASVPVAVYCWVVPFAMLLVSGDKAIDATGEDLKAAEPDRPSNVAVIVAVPSLIAVVSPFEPVSLTVATDGSAEVQVAKVVKFCWVLLLSDNVPEAVNCKLVVGAMLGGAGGVTLMDETFALVRVAVPVMPLKTTVMIVVPVVVAAVTSPLEPAALLMSAIPASDELQFTDVVIYCFMLFEYVPMAKSCVVVPGAMAGLAGAIAIDVRVGVGPLWITPPPPPHAANRAENKRVTFKKPGPCFIIFSCIR